jgi:iron complex transport system substrate-binding protein
MDKNVSAVFWFSSADLQLDPYVAGKFGPAAWIAQTLGVKNIIDSAEEWPTVGWETIAKANPSVIVLGEMSRRRFPADDWKIKMEYLQSDPVTKLFLPSKKTICRPLTYTMNAGIRTIDGVEKLADALVEYGSASAGCSLIYILRYITAGISASPLLRTQIIMSDSRRMRRAVGQLAVKSVVMPFGSVR